MINGIIKGVLSHVDALKVIARHGLWGYFVAPAIISILLGIIILGTAWGMTDDIGHWLGKYYPWEWGSAIVERIIGVFGGLAIAIVGFILFKNLVIAFASPFMSPLSEKVEQILSNAPKPKATSFSYQKFLGDLIRGITIALRNVIRELFFTFLLFLLGLIPIFTPITTVLIFVIQAFYAGFGNIDFLLERHFNVNGSVRFVRKNRGLAIGNGLVFLLLFLTGIGFLIALPLGTVAATIEGVKRLPNQQTDVPTPYV